MRSLLDMSGNPSIAATPQEARTDIYSGVATKGITMDYFQGKRLREERAVVVKQIHDIARSAKEEGREFNAEELQRFDALDASQKELQSKIDSAERVERAESLVITQADKVLPFQHKSQIVTAQDHEMAFRAWALNKVGEIGSISRSHVEAAERVGLNLATGSIRVKLSRDVSEAITDGAKAENTGMIQGVESAMLTYGPVRNVATVLRTSNANALPWVTENDTTNLATAREKLDEAGNVNLAFNKVTLGAFSYGSGVYPVARETIEDTGIPLTQLIAKNLGARIARKENKVHTNGAGTTEPTGICVAVTPAWQYLYDDDTNWYDILIRMYHGVDAAYREGNKVGFMMTDDLLAEIKLSVDTTGRPLWVPGMAVGAPDTLLGKPFFVNNDMAAPDDESGCSILFGDFSKFLIRDVGEVQITVLNERYAELNAVAFVAFHRTDSALINADAICGAIAGTGSFVNCGTPISST